MRGDLVSRPIDSVMEEAQILVDAGIREILVISQDTSAYGVDSKYATRFWRGQPLRTRFLDLCRALTQLGVWVRLHYVYPYPHVDDVIPLMADGSLLPYLDIPFQHASKRISESDETPRKPGARAGTNRQLARDLPGTGHSQHLYCGFSRRNRGGFSRNYSIFSIPRNSIGSVALPIPQSMAPPPINCRIRFPRQVKQERYHRFMLKQQEISSQQVTAAESASR